MSLIDQPVCLFCNDSEDQTEVFRITLAADWTNATGTYWCHGSCLQEATHSTISLYLLSLRRDVAVYGAKQPQLGDGEQTTDRSLSEREAFRSARYFLQQFNEREKSDVIDLLLHWMTEGTWESDPLETSDPAQWFDWVESVDRVIAERGEPSETQ